MNSKNSRHRGFSLIEVLVVVLMIVVITGMAVPRILTFVQNLRTSGDARDLNSTILLAKMRASADYTQARVHVDLNSRTFWVEIAPPGIAVTASTGWNPECCVQYLSAGVTFGFGTLTSPPGQAPLGMQTTLAQAPACTGFSNSACITFNSRGIPVDSSNAPTSSDAIYVTDGKDVSGVLVSVTGLTQIWRSDLAGGPNWIQR